MKGMGLIALIAAMAIVFYLKQQDIQRVQADQINNTADQVEKELQQSLDLQQQRRDQANH